jgi:hypothetical protein
VIDSFLVKMTLKDILKRLIHLKLLRKYIILNAYLHIYWNCYLLVAPNKTRHNTPVGHVFIWGIVRQASVQALGVACNPNTLRKSAAVMFADRAGAGILRWMGWDDQQAFAYTWAAREMLQPQQLGGPQALNRDLQKELIPFPSPKERTERCDD